MPESITQTETLRMGELRQRLRGYDFDEYTGRWVLQVRGFGRVFVNGNVIKRFKGISGVLSAPGDWLASVSEWHGEYWLYRVSSPEYVDIPAGTVINTVKEILPGITSFGRWEAERVWRYEGAEYGELTGFLGRGEHPQVGDFVYLVRVSWGNDGYSAFKVFRVLGILKCTNGLVTGFNSFKRIFHSRLTGPIEEKVRDVLNRIRNAIQLMNDGSIESLMRPVDAKVIEDLSKRFPDFQRLYAEYKPQYGDTMMAVFQALGWIATHGSSRNSEKAINSMTRLLASLN
jgi:hypothetical protein